MNVNTNAEQRKTHISSLTNPGFKQETRFQDFDWESLSFDQKANFREMDGEPLQSRQEILFQVTDKNPPQSRQDTIFQDMDSELRQSDQEWTDANTSMLKQESLLSTHLKYINFTLENYLDLSIDSEDILRCANYSVSGGKKIRSQIYLMVINDLLKKKGSLVTERQRGLLNDGFIYIELIHSASLILDDMPYMDNDLVRRERPAAHIEFGKGKAQLCAFILIQLAHQHLSDTMIKLYKSGYLNTDQYVNLQVFLSETRCDFLGEKGLAGGQYLDLYGMSTNDDLELYMQMIEKKTSRLFELAFILPYCLVYSLGSLCPNIFEKHRLLGCKMGLVFQLLDDLADVEGKDKSSTSLVSILSSQGEFSLQHLGEGSSEFAPPTIDMKNNTKKKSIEFFTQAFDPTGKNVLSYISQAAVNAKIKELYRESQVLSKDTGLDLTTIWKQF